MLKKILNRRRKWAPRQASPARRRFFALRGEALEARWLLAPVNSPPVAVNDSFVALEEAPLTIAAPGVLTNDQDSDNDKLSAAAVTQPAHGTLTLNPDGGFVYVPFGNYSG